MRIHRMLSIVALTLFAVGARPALAADDPPSAAGPMPRPAHRPHADTPPRHPADTGAHGTVNLNTADAPVLEQLPGIGEKKAERIIVYRHAHPFRKVEDLTRVRGFGKKTLARLKPFLSVSGPTTMGEPESAPK